MQVRTRCFMPPQKRKSGRIITIAQPSQSLFKGFFSHFGPPFIKVSFIAVFYPTLQTALFTFLSLKKKTMQNKYSFCGRQWTIPIHPGRLKAHLRPKE